MKLAILGGGGVRMPALVHALLAPARSDGPPPFSEIVLFEPDRRRRETTGRLALELARVLGRPEVLCCTADPEEALSAADFVFSAIRVGGDEARVVDEEVALSFGLVGQETTGPGGCAMALRTIPVVLDYCRMIERVAPQAILVNFTNPAGIVTQAVAEHSHVQAVGVCDTPSSTIERLCSFLAVPRAEVAFDYGGLNHLGWITSLQVAGEEQLESLLARYEELQSYDHRLAALDAELVRRVGALPTEYLFYYYDPARYVERVRAAGASRGQEVRLLNHELADSLAQAFDTDGFDGAWAAYSRLLGVRHDTYMQADIEGPGGHASARARRADEPPPALGEPRLDGYEAVAVALVHALRGDTAGCCGAELPVASSAGSDTIVLNTANGSSLAFLDADDVVEVQATVTRRGIAPLGAGELPRSARGLVTQVKEYERSVVTAAVSGDAGLAELALALHPLVPGVTVARSLLGEYRRRHGPSLSYLR